MARSAGFLGKYVNSGVGCRTCENLLVGEIYYGFKMFAFGNDFSDAFAVCCLPEFVGADIAQETIGVK